MRAVATIAFAVVLLCVAPQAHADSWVSTVEQIDPTRADNPGLATLNLNSAGEPCVPSLSSPDCKTFKIPQRATGGRVRGLAHAGGATFYAASEWGGLFRTTDGGQEWERVDGFAPSATYDVEVDPFNSNRIYATSLYDGAGAPKGAISVSPNGGLTWRRPATGIPPENFCLTEDGTHPDHARDARRLEPSAFAIAVDHDHPGTIYVGTNCGLAKSQDSGNSWRFIDPTSGNRAATVWGVVVHHGVVDICGDDGHRRSSDGGVTWTGVSFGGVDQSSLPGSGRCVIAASPHERDVLFVALGSTLYTSIDGGINWPTMRNVPRAGRFLFVATHQRSATDFDLYFGNKDLWRIPCKSAANSIAASITPRCPAVPMSFAQAGAHRDVGDIAFAGNGCPALYASDGGVYRNARLGFGCHDPQWLEAETTTRALWVWALTGLKRGNRQELYFGAQDNGFFATDDARAATPVWRAEDCCDVYDAAADSDQALFTRCCEGAGRSNLILIRPPGPSGPKKLPNTDYPGGNATGIAKIPSSSDGSVIVSYAKDSFAVVTDQGVFYTRQIDAVSRDWRELGTWDVKPKNLQDIKVSHAAGGAPVFYVLASSHTLSHSEIHTQDGRAIRPNELFKHIDVDTGKWAHIQGARGIGVLAVDPNDPKHLIASRVTNHRRGDTPPAVARMKESFDGGETWSSLTELDTMMTAGGIAYANARGPVKDVWFTGYAQPTLVKFGPAGSGMIVAGAADAGLFISYDNGATWTTLSTAIPRPRFAYFDRVGPKQINVFVGSQGRGLWRINLKRQ